MADAAQTSVETVNNCTRCKNPARTGIKCVRCGKVSHKSCLKMLKNVKFLEDDKVVCCPDLSDEQACNMDKPSVTSLDGESSPNLSLVDDVLMPKISYLEEIIRQKDLIISNQSIAITALNEQIILLKETKRLSGSPILTPADVSQESANKHSNKKQPVKVAAPVASTSARPIISEKFVANAIHNANAQSICTEVINLESNGIKRSQRPANSTTPNSKSRSRKILIGNRDNPLDCPFKAAAPRSNRQMYEYHVTNLDSKTDVSVLDKYLKGFSSNIVIEKLHSKNPEKYSSFKLSVPAAESSSILDSNIWPEGVVVNRFFRPKSSGGQQLAK